MSHLRIPSMVIILCAVYLLTSCKPTTVVEDLGTLGGPSFGFGINAVGNVCGASYLNSNDPHGGGLHAFLFISGLGMIDVGALPSGNISAGQGINNANFIVGGSFVDNAGDSVPHAFLANATLNLTDLGTLGGEFSNAWGINNHQQITGEAEDRTLHRHAFIRTADGLRDLGTLGGDTSVGRSINDSGQVAGESRIGASTATRAFRFTEGLGMVNLGTLSGGTNSSGYGINNSGQVVGESDTGPILTTGFRLPGFQLSGTHAFLWTDGAGMKDLGHLGGGTSRATAISNTVIVVGASTLIDGSSHAFRWTQAAGMIDLNTLLPRNSGWVLLSADGVNDRGQITGTGVHNGAQRAYRFNPPEVIASPSPATAKAQ